MTADTLSPKVPLRGRPKASAMHTLRDLADSIIFYGLFGVGVLAPLCLALYSELIR